MKFHVPSSPLWFVSLQLEKRQIKRFSKKNDEKFAQPKRSCRGTSVLPAAYINSLFPFPFQDVIDPYYTLIGYHNSIRELGGTVRLLQDDIPKRILRIQNRYQMSKRRYLNHRIEITSRMNSFEIPNKLKQLEAGFGSKDCLDTAVATNMIAVCTNPCNILLAKYFGRH